LIERRGAEHRFGPAGSGTLTRGRNERVAARATLLGMTTTGAERVPQQKGVPFRRSLMSQSIGRSRNGSRTNDPNPVAQVSTVIGSPNSPVHTRVRPAHFPHLKKRRAEHRRDRQRDDEREQDATVTVMPNWKKNGRWSLS